MSRVEMTSCDVCGTPEPSFFMRGLEPAPGWFHVTGGESRHTKIFGWDLCSTTCLEIFVARLAGVPEDMLAPRDLTIDEVAETLRLVFTRGPRKGEAKRAAVHELIKAGKLALVDETAPIGRWRVSVAEVDRYMNAVAS